MNSAASSAGSGAAPLGSATVTVEVTCSVLIPAFNEADTIAQVVGVAREASLGQVVVVDDGSRDGTAATARLAGAEVIELNRNQGKGGAVAAGLENVRSGVIVLVDADLVGLLPAHLRALAGPVLAGEADMTRGVFVGGRWRTTAAQRLTPQLSGQRAVRRELLEAVPELASTRFGIEVAITGAAKRQGWRCLDVRLEGVSQVMKEEKRGLLAGLAMRLRMYRDIVATMIRRSW
ncbi:MAG: glycosyltransferase family 2 protein [Trueperaceae bacterium]